EVECLDEIRLEVVLVDVLIDAAQVVVGTAELRGSDGFLVDLRDHGVFAAADKGAAHAPEDEDEDDGDEDELHPRGVCIATNEFQHRISPGRTIDNHSRKINEITG